MASTSGPSTGDPSPLHLREERKAETRRRLIEAGLRLFAEQGYDATTAAQVAEAAGVTERTFFRHFKTKADLLLVSWRLHMGAATEAMSGLPAGTPTVEMVRHGLRAFVEALEADDKRSDHAAGGHWSRAPVVELLSMVVTLEATLAKVLSLHLGLSEDDVEIRTAANASVGVVRACGRAYLVGDPLDVIEAVDAGIVLLTPLYDHLDERSTPNLG